MVFGAFRHAAKPCREEALAKKQEVEEQRQGSPRRISIRTLK
jgi:hypothetical protein